MSDPTLERYQRMRLTMQGLPTSNLADSVLVRHPPALPTPFPGLNRYLCIRTPNPWSPTADWVAFHAKWHARAEAVDEAVDPVPAALRQAAQAALNWRAALPEHLHFWREDPPAST